MPGYSARHAQRSANCAYDHFFAGAAAGAPALAAIFNCMALASASYDRIAR